MKQLLKTRTPFLFVRKSYMTLLETLVAMSLLSIVLVFVFGFFRELSHLTQAMDGAQKESFQMRYVESRLNYLFERLVNENETTKRLFLFYTEPANREFSHSTSLIFTYNNEVRQEPTFSGDVLGRLYVDLNHNLCLATWPLHIPEPHQYLHNEILIPHVTQLSFSFYAAPRSINGKKDPAFIDPKKQNPAQDQWHKEAWPATYEQMPSIMKILVDVAKNPKDLSSHWQGMKIETQTLTFYFVLPSAKNPIHYPPFETRSLS